MFYNGLYVFLEIFMDFWEFFGDQEREKEKRNKYREAML